MFYLLHSPGVGSPLLTSNNGYSFCPPSHPSLYAPVHTGVHQQSQCCDFLVICSELPINGAPVNFNFFDLLESLSH